jgi:hypothetical protein
MKVVVLYRPDSEHSRLVEEFIHEYQSRVGESRFEIVNVDSRDGIATASLYDVVQYPAIVVMQDDGYMHKLWQGTVPMISEVASYARI